MENKMTLKDLNVPIIFVCFFNSAIYLLARFWIEGNFFKSTNEMIFMILILSPSLINYYLNISVFNAMYVILKQKYGENEMILQMIDPKSFINSNKPVP